MYIIKKQKKKNVNEFQLSISNFTCKLYAFASRERTHVDLPKQNKKSRYHVNNHNAGLFLIVLK